MTHQTQYSHGADLIFGYDGGSFNERSGPNSVLEYRLSRCTREPRSFKEEMLVNAELMRLKAEALGRPIYLLQSGGMDSEVMIKSFIAAGIPFKTITFRYPHGQNSHELKFVEQFVATEKLNTQFFDFDFLSWLKTQEAKDLFFQTHCTGVSMLPHMKLIEHVWFELGGMPVLGGGDIVILKKPEGWMYSKYEDMLPWYWYCSQHEIDCGVAFFQHTSEGTLAALREPGIARAGLGNDALANKILPDTRQIKYNMYAKNWPELKIRKKFVGSELIYRDVLRIDAEWNREKPFPHDAIWSIPYASAVELLVPSDDDQAGSAVAAEL